MAGSCLMMRTRVLSRVVTSMYDDVLRPLRIQASQLNLLAVIACAGPLRRNEIGKMMHLDSSTLTRNLRVMESNGWIEEVSAGSDGRGCPLRISRKGDALVAKAFPAWKDAQRRAAVLFGDAGAASLMNVSNAMIWGGG